MQIILDILKRAGGWHPGLSLKIDNQPYMSLVIEAIDESGPCGLPAISVTHYGEQDGDLMRDPEMCFELGLAGGAHLNPFSWRNDYVGVEQWSRFIIGTDYVFHRALYQEHLSFAKVWDRNLRSQGFVGGLRATDTARLTLPVHRSEQESCVRSTVSASLSPKENHRAEQQRMPVHRY